MSNNQDMSKLNELSNTRSADLNMVAREEIEPVVPNQVKQALIEDEAEEVDDQVIEHEEAEADAMQENDFGESLLSESMIEESKPNMTVSEQSKIKDALKDF